MNEQDFSRERGSDDEHLLVTDKLFKKLDFVPSQNLSEASAAIIDGLLNPGRTSVEALGAAWSEYARIAEKDVEASSDYAKAQIGVQVNKAAIFASAGKTARYLSELDSADIYAHNAGLDDISELLTTEVDTVCKELEPSAEQMILRLRGIVSDSNREYLRELMNDGADDQDLVGDAYGMIIAEGGDPDAVLRSIGIVE